MTLISDPVYLTGSVADDGTTNVYINVLSSSVKLNLTGALTTDGVTLKALYSFLKNQWRNDPQNQNLAAFPFPMVPITDENFEFVNGWDMANDSSRYLIRTAGWTVADLTGTITQKWAGIVGLGSVPGTAQLYFDQQSGSLDFGAANFQLTGQVNQAVRILSGTDDRRNYLKRSSPASTHSCTRSRRCPTSASRRWTAKRTVSRWLRPPI